MAPAKCKVPKAAKITKDIVDAIRVDSLKKKEEVARKAAADKITELVIAAGVAEEPYLIDLLEIAITLSGDNKAKSVREAADLAMAEFPKKLSEFSVRACLKPIFVGFNSQFWQSKMAALHLVDSFVARNHKAVAACLPEIIPELAQVMVDMRDEVKLKSTDTMAKVATCVRNIDIDPFIPTLIECIEKVDEVPECVHKLAATTFVQQVEAPTLSIMGPLLQRGLFFQQVTAIKRKSAVIIDNMCKLVEDPMDAAPFLAKLLPLLKRAMDEVADPECRQVCTRAYKTLLTAAGESIDAVIDENTDSSKRTSEVAVAAQFTDMMCEMTGAKEAEVTTFLESAEVAPYFQYICKLATNALLAKNFDLPTWKKSCATPYLSLFFEGAEAATQTLVDKAHAAYQASKKVFIVEDEEGEDLCKCDFSLAYGALILLSNATLHMKKGKRYGLCGPNGCGKSTLMKAINNGQVDGFPPPEELRTVYVEHDIQGDQHDMTIVEFVMSDEVIKGHGTSAEDVTATLQAFQFTDRQIKGSVMALSGGWKMKLALARAILMKADIFLLDEPTNHLDTKNKAWLEEYLISQTTVSSMIVSHDSGFLDRVCTHIIHYETRKLVTYKGNLTEFIKQCPAAKKYTELSNDELKFIFPVPGFLEGVKNKDKAIVKANNCHYTYPNTDRKIVNGGTIQLSLSSRVACLGPNGAGKSTFIKLLTGEAEPDIGTVWRHPNMRYAYVAQHAFHHVEQHLEKTPNEYIRWRYQTGEDKENLTKVTAQYTPEEERLMKEKIPVPQEDGSILKLVVEKLISRRQKKSKYEYEVQWKGLSMDASSWVGREQLEKFGFLKYMNRVDEREAARAGLYARPLTTANVEKHLIDFGLEAEFGTHNRIKGLSGGQKVKLVLGSAMWQQPHVIVMDEPTNYLDRDALGALACAVKEFGGGVLLITHNCEFADALKEETWECPGDGTVYVSGNKWGQGKKGAKETIIHEVQEDALDALGNIVKIKGPKKKLSRKEIKAKAKSRGSKLAEGQDLTTDSDWDLDEYIGEAKETKADAAKKA
uniref:Chromo domain-containing protein n=1 Tax=Mantoniella antarctica TaxID=81844 RepID=A0A7S0S758_9CHLO